MEEFAKLFSVGTNQVLIQKAYDDDEDTFKLEQTTHESGMVMKMTLGYNSEEERDKSFENYGPKNAKVFISAIHKIMAQSAS